MCYLSVLVLRVIFHPEAAALPASVKIVLDLEKNVILVNKMARNPMDCLFGLVGKCLALCQASSSNGFGQNRRSFCLTGFCV